MNTIKPLLKSNFLIFLLLLGLSAFIKLSLSDKKVESNNQMLSFSL